MRRTTWIAIGLGLAGLGGACGKTEVDSPPGLARGEDGAGAVASPGSDVSGAPADATSTRPVLPELPESERASAAECEAMADGVFKLTEKELADRKVPEAQAILDAMRAGRADFLTRCQTRISRATVACVRGAGTLMDVKACGPNATPPPVAREASAGGHDHAPGDGHHHGDGHDHGPPPTGEKASEADCKAFVKKLDALMAARLAPEERAKAAAASAEQEAKQALIVKQCTEQAPASVIRCALAAADLPGIDRCHENAGQMSEDAPKKAPSGPLASQADCRAFVGHFVAINAAAAPPAEAAKMRARMTENLEAMTAHCAREVPAEVVRCGLAAKTVADLERCDIATPGPRVPQPAPSGPPGSAPGSSGLAAPAPSAPSGSAPGSSGLAAPAPSAPSRPATPAGAAAPAR